MKSGKMKEMIIHRPNFKYQRQIVDVIVFNYFFLLLPAPQYIFREHTSILPFYTNFPNALASPTSHAQYARADFGNDSPPERCRKAKSF